MEKVFTENVANSLFFGMGIDDSTKANIAKLKANVTYLDKGVRKTKFLDSVELTRDKDLVLKALRSKDTDKIKKAMVIYI